MREPVIAYIGLGANLGDSRATVLQALNAIADLDGLALTRQSSLYGSAPVDSSGDDYVNAVAEVQTRLKPHADRASAMSAKLSCRIAKRLSAAAKAWPAATASGSLSKASSRPVGAKRASSARLWPPRP